MGKLLSVIIPVFNEQTSVIQVVERTLQMPLPEDLDLEIIIVDDGSTDDTASLLKDYLSRHPESSPRVHVHYSVLNFGKGVAVRVGLRYAQGDVIAIQDADLEYDPHQLKDLIAPVLANSHDVVFGSRYRGRKRGMVFFQDLGNRVLTGFTNLLYGSHLTDAYTCYKIFTRSVGQYLSRNMKCRGFELEAEMTALILRQQLRVLELPIQYEARSRAQGKKIRAWDGIVGLAWLLHYRMRRLQNSND